MMLIWDYDLLHVADNLSESQGMCYHGMIGFFHSILTRRWRFSWTESPRSVILVRRGRRLEEERQQGWYPQENDGRKIPQLFDERPIFFLQSPQEPESSGRRGPLGPVHQVEPLPTLRVRFPQALPGPATQQSH